MSTHTWTEWAVAWPYPYLSSRPTGKIWDLAPYDDEDDARDHLEQHGPDAFLVSRELTATLWARVEPRDPAAVAASSSPSPSPR